MQKAKQCCQSCATNRESIFAADGSRTKSTGSSRKLATKTLDFAYSDAKKTQASRTSSLKSRCTAEMSTNTLQSPEERSHRPLCLEVDSSYESVTPFLGGWVEKNEKETSWRDLLEPKWQQANPLHLSPPSNLLPLPPFNIPNHSRLID